MEKIISYKTSLYFLNCKQLPYSIDIIFINFFTIFGSYQLSQKSDPQNKQKIFFTKSNCQDMKVIVFGKSYRPKGPWQEGGILTQQHLKLSGSIIMTPVWKVDQYILKRVHQWQYEEKKKSILSSKLTKVTQSLFRKMIFSNEVLNLKWLLLSQYWTYQGCFFVNILILIEWKHLKMKSGGHRQSLGGNFSWLPPFEGAKGGDPPPKNKFVLPKVAK